MTALDYGLLLGLGALWGSSYPFIKVALAGHIAPFEIVLFRLVLATLALYVVVRVQGLSMPRTRRVWRSFAIMGLIGTACPFFFISWGETRITSSLAAILNSTVPFFTVLLAHFWARDERLTAVRLLGVAIGFAGVVVLVGNVTSGSFAWALPGTLSLLAASCCYGIANNFARGAFRGIQAEVAATGQMLLGAVFVAGPGTAAAVTARAAPTPAGLAAVAGLGLLGTALAYLLYYRLIARVGPSRTSMVGYLLPAFSVVYGAFLLHETVTARLLFGFALILAGIAVVNGRARRRRHEAPGAARAAR